MAFCRIKGRECKHAGQVTTFGCPEFGEEPGMHIHPICYNDEINRDFTKCE